MERRYWKPEQLILVRSDAGDGCRPRRTHPRGRCHTQSRATQQRSENVVNETMKTRAPWVVQTLYMSDDCYRELMADSDNPGQPFLVQLPIVIPEEKGQILLDGFVREYAGLESWVAYIDQERQSMTYKNAGSDLAKRPS